MADVVAEWNRIPGRLRAAVRGLEERELDRRGGEEGWSIRETIHHLVEANLIASNMIIAALATDGYAFDWTWVNPTKAWMRKVGYDKAPIDPAIAMLRAICRHLSGLIAGTPGSLERTVKLNDAPGRPRYVRTIAEILSEQVDHATGHLGDIRKIRS